MFIFLKLSLLIIFGVLSILVFHYFSHWFAETRGDECKTCPIVTLPGLGKVKGYTQKSLHGREYFAFEGIPYAVPPIGNKRFEAPEPVAPWPGVFDATMMGGICMQWLDAFVVTEEVVIGTEDCLNINIYTPGLSDSNLDVVFFIPGGAFQYNFGVAQKPTFLLDYNVVYVSFNYRLGVLGFLSTEDNIVPGNNGLKDQILALKFVQKYIQHFGGNSNSITIYGQSAGAASASFHIFSTRSKNLFHKAIFQSGSILNCWAVTEKPLQKTQALADIVGCPKTPKEMVSCFRTKSARVLVGHEELNLPFHFKPFSVFAVVVDKWARNPILPDEPIKLFQNLSQIPVLISHTNADGLYPAAFHYSPSALTKLNQHWNEFAPFLLHYNSTVLPEMIDEVSEKIRLEYLSKDELSMGTFNKFVEMCTDRIFIYDIRKMITTIKKFSKAPIYFYDYSYRGAHSVSEIWSRSNKKFGACHCDDLGMILELDILNVLSTKNDRQMQETMTKMIVSFARTGTPDMGIEWKPVGKDGTKIETLKILGPRNFSMLSQEYLIGKFWDDLPILENGKVLEKNRKYSKVSKENKSQENNFGSDSLEKNDNREDTLRTKEEKISDDGAFKNKPVDLHNEADEIHNPKENSSNIEINTSDVKKSNESPEENEQHPHEDTKESSPNDKFEVETLKEENNPQDTSIPKDDDSNLANNPLERENIDNENKKEENSSNENNLPDNEKYKEHTGIETMREEDNVQDTSKTKDDNGDHGNKPLDLGQEDNEENTTVENNPPDTKEEMDQTETETQDENQSQINTDVSEPTESNDELKRTDDVTENDSANNK